jgi:hypothetical protein
MKKDFNPLLILEISKTYGRIFLFIISLPLSAQNITNEANVYIPAGMEVRTQGSLTNTGFFQNNGSFSLTGDWINTSIYQGTGIVLLEGSDQLLSNIAQPISHLVIRGGGTKTLEGNILINNKIDFLNGVVLVHDSDTLLMSSTCIVNTGSIISYVDGALTSQGNGYKFFPVGKNSNYHPVELLDVTGISPTVEIEVFENLPFIQTSVPTTIKQDIYWARNTIRGTFENSPITVGYNIQGATSTAHIVIAESEQFTDEFAIIDNVTFQSTTDVDIIGSRRAVTGNIFAIGELIVPPPKQYYLSTTLSPNAQNPDNRTAKVFGDVLSPVDFYFQVFNRWGLLVFESQSYENMATRGWDGSQHGNVLPSGVYPYSIKYVDTAGKAVQRTGFVTIIH